MKKYFSILAAILFCSMSFALTACGDDDDDEPSNGGGSNTLTINGEKYTCSDPTYFIYNAGTLDPFDDNGKNTPEYSFSYWPFSSNDDSDFDALDEMCLNIEGRIKANTTIAMDDLSYFRIGLNPDFRFTNKSGQIKIVSVSSNSVTLTFDNCKCVRESSSRTFNITINGTATFKAQN